MLLKRVPPTKGVVYTLSEIYDGLDLLDDPHLIIEFNDASGAIQDSHILHEQALAIPEIAETLWCYQRTTLEWIPIFHYAGTLKHILNIVDVEAMLDLNKEIIPGSLWITYKAFPRSQD